MILMNLLVALVAGLILFEPFTRTPMSRSVRFSGHRSRARRAFAQAGAALVASMVVATSNPSPQQISPVLVFGSAGHSEHLLGVARPALAETRQDVRGTPVGVLIGHEPFAGSTTLHIPAPLTMPFRLGRASAYWQNHQDLLVHPKILNIRGGRIVTP